MKRIYDESLKNYNKDTIIALRIRKGEFYFLGWMEDAADYSMQIPVNVEACKLARNIVETGDIAMAISLCSGYNRMYNICSQKEGNEYNEFLSHIKPYTNNGADKKNLHDIFEVSQQELHDICGALRDGDYVFVVENMDEI
jgi:hypothetical protein